MCYYSGEAAFSVAISDICYVGLTQPSLSQKKRSKGVIVERLKVDVPQPHYSDGLLLDLASS